MKHDEQWLGQMQGALIAEMNDRDLALQYGSLIAKACKEYAVVMKPIIIGDDVILANTLRSIIQRASESIKDLSEVIAPDYGYSESTNDGERIYAIKAAHSGTEQALAGAHRVIADLRERLDLTPDDIAELWLRLDDQTHVTES